jgi:phage repressor protein C with HTH and peptisase S24 domain
MTTLAERMTEALGDKGCSRTSLAIAAGVKPPSVTDWMNGRTKTLRGAPAYRASAFLGVNYLWLTEGKGPKKIIQGSMATTEGANQPVDSFAIPRLDVTGSMGDGSDYPETDTVIERMTLKGEWLRKVVPSRHISDLAIISGKGNSMEPTFKDGDLLLVDTSIRAVDVDGVYVMSAHNRLFIKSVRQRIDGSFEISSDNPSVKTTDILDGSNPVDVHGRVVFAWNGRGL